MFSTTLKTFEYEVIDKKSDSDGCYIRADYEKKDVAVWIKVTYGFYKKTDIGDTVVRKDVIENRGGS